MDIGEKAAQYNKNGYNCAQSVLCVCGEHTGLDEKTALAVSSGFGGGLRSGEVCGAIAGAVMALGLVFPYDDCTNLESKHRAARLAQECVERCRQACGAVTCRDLKAPDGLCIKDKAALIAACARIAEEMINENKEK